MMDFATGVALVLVLEGLLWAVAPESMKKAAVLALAMANTQLRRGGLLVATFGVFILWLLRG